MCFLITTHILVKHFKPRPNSVSHSYSFSFSYSYSCQWARAFSLVIFKIYIFSEGVPFFYMMATTVPVHLSEGSFVRRFICPKVHLSEGFTRQDVNGRWEDALLWILMKVFFSGKLVVVDVEKTFGRRRARLGYLNHVIRTQEDVRKTFTIFRPQPGEPGGSIGFTSVRPSVRPSVRLSVRPSVRPSR